MEKSLLAASPALVNHIGQVDMSPGHCRYTCHEVCAVLHCNVRFRQPCSGHCHISDLWYGPGAGSWSIAPKYPCSSSRNGGQDLSPDVLRQCLVLPPGAIERNSERRFSFPPTGVCAGLSSHPVGGCAGEA
ncbi:hypothetical protein AM571_CH02895 [Rhizobium etli 8C-3]|uniref:Uncharacterized protein n=1 Tax=Rhizobium etli 8C-3 TaxID=538025 RepID=A0A1L5P699_RHIET|nr:hypothetical protein AM571_CH02895 [Rhizobium etli 8C-3]